MVFDRDSDHRRHHEDDRGRDGPRREPPYSANAVAGSTAAAEPRAEADKQSGRDNEYIFSTSVVASARDEADLGKLASSDQWTMTEAEDNQRVWTDDYSNVLGAVWRRLRKGEE